jgi:hypothetical protein
VAAARRAKSSGAIILKEQLATKEGLQRFATKASVMLDGWLLSSLKLLYTRSDSHCDVKGAIASLYNDEESQKTQ